jgi:hypothetical protein
VLSFVVIVPIALIVLGFADLTMAQFAAVLIIGQVGIRKTYRLSVNVDPKINAFLILEKVRTGMTISEIVETILKEYQKLRRIEASGLGTGWDSTLSLVETTAPSDVLSQDK